MEAKVKELKSGKVKYLVYDPNDIEVTRVKGLVRDIYENANGFDKKIVWISKVIPVQGSTHQDVLKEYFKKAEDKAEITFVQAGVLKEIPEAGDIEESIALIEAEKDLLWDTNFTGLLWNRKMAHVFGNPDYFIYNNANGKAFVKDNLGGIIVTVQSKRA